MRDRMRLKTRACFFTVVALGLCVFGLAIYQTALQEPGIGWLVLAVMVIPTFRFTVSLPGKINSRISIADTLIFANAILFGPAAGTITAALDGLMGSLRVAETARRLQYSLFNIASMALSAYLGGQVFRLVFGAGPLFYVSRPDAGDVVLPALLMALTHYVANSGTVATMVALELRRGVWSVWRERFLWTSVTYFASASAAAVTTPFAHTITLASLGLIIPIMAIIYFTSKVYLDRAEERGHRKQLDGLYLRTVEALTVAIDAREAGTLGHSRRIQFYAAGLGRAMQVKDEAQMKGIEAAALLLDIGNLAIPEYILNNPGELSRSEFQKVMIHPVVGANIISTIDFPYPVQESVRHHHERWDGSGYPDGLKGEEIPLGARLLAVADCYVALTTERPYQKARSHEAALSVIRAKSGLAYDPEVVGKFLKIVDRLNLELAESEGRTVDPDAGAAGRLPGRGKLELRMADLDAYQDISTTQKEVAALHTMTQELAATVSLEKTLEIVARQTSKIFTSATGSLYLCCRDEHRLISRGAFGLHAAAFAGHAMDIGKGVSGWSAAQREPVLNGKAHHDMAGMKNLPLPALVAALAHPLICGPRCLGVITLYSGGGERFGDEDQRLLAGIAQQAAPAIQRALRYEEVREDAVKDALTGLHNVRFFRQSLGQALDDARHNLSQLAVLVMDLDGFKAVNDVYGHQAGDLVLAKVAGILNGLFRSEDLIARYGGDEFVALLPGSTLQTAQNLAQRTREAVDNAELRLASGEAVHVGISIGAAAFPADGDSSDDLLKKADSEMYQDKARRAGPRSRIALHA